MSNPALACTRARKTIAPACISESQNMACTLGEDPIWNADWTQLAMPALQCIPKTVVACDELHECTPKTVEVYEMHGQQTWLARRRARRDRAERALNQKLVRRINRELAAASVDKLKEAAAAKQEVHRATDACLDEVEELSCDIWGLDWTALSDWQACHHVLHGHG
mmetsp:Transcript_15516/g.30555  ORF Transcript_15516/g.30555 Transcript_15516/m.30555 type:complete len:166 (+) Transcript_15516:56-553(+)